MRAASLGATPLSQAGQRRLYEERSSPLESGVVDAGLRRASLPPHSKTLSRSRGHAHPMPGMFFADEEVLIYNSFMSKRDWRDDETDGFIPDMIRQYGLKDDGSAITDFDITEMVQNAWHCFRTLVTPGVMLMLTNAPIGVSTRSGTGFTILTTAEKP